MNMPIVAHLGLFVPISGHMGKNRKTRASTFVVTCVENMYTKFQENRMKTEGDQF